MPDLPTTVEAGYPNSDYNFWVGALVAAKTPREIVERLHKEINTLVQSPEISERIRKLGADPLTMSVAEFDAMIAREVVRSIAGPTAARKRITGGAIPVGVSVRHVHLSRGDCDALFGQGYELTPKRAVTQPGQYVCRETVDLVGPKGAVERVAIINPLRKETQVEVAKTDAFVLGVQPPLRESGQLEGTPGLTLRRYGCLNPLRCGNSRSQGSKEACRRLPTPAAALLQPS